MKKTQKATILKTALLTIMIVVLLATFVACDPSPAGTNPDENFDLENSSLFTTGIPSYTEFESFIAHSFNRSTTEDTYCLFDIGMNPIETYDLVDDSVNDFYYKGAMASVIIVDDFGEEVVTNFAIIVYENNEMAKEAETKYIDLHEDAVVVRKDNVIMAMGYYYFENNHSDVSQPVYEQSESEIINFYNNVKTSKLPDNALSEARSQFIKEAYDKYLKNNSFSSLKSTRTHRYVTFATGQGSEYFRMGLTTNASNLMNEMSYETSRSTSQIINYDPKWYTSDSYIDFNREEGYVFLNLIEKLGYQYKSYSYQDIEGVEITEYVYDKTSPENLVIPATIDGKRVLRVSGVGCRIAKTIELSEGVLSYDEDINDKVETIILPKSLLRVGNVVYGCPSLKTIKYNGTKAEWLELVKYDDPSEWEVGSYYDENDQIVEKYITFKVECADGNTIVYSHE